MCLLFVKQGFHAEESSGLCEDTSCASTGFYQCWGQLTSLVEVLLGSLVGSLVQQFFESESWSNPQPVLRPTECRLCRWYHLYFFPWLVGIFFLLSHTSLSLLYLITQWLSSTSLWVQGFFFSLSLWLFPVVSTQCVFSGAGKSESLRY